MAGHLALTLPDGTKFSLLLLQGHVTGGSNNPDGSITFRGTGTQATLDQSHTWLNLPVKFTTTIRPGGAGVKGFVARLVFLTPAAPFPSTVTLNERVVDGMIVIH
jgi:hypothetical protein